MSLRSRSHWSPIFFAKHHSFNENALLEGNLGAGAKTDGHLWVTHPAETTGRGKVEFG